MSLFKLFIIEFSIEKDPKISSPMQKFLWSKLIETLIMKLLWDKMHVQDYNLQHKLVYCNTILSILNYIHTHKLYYYIHHVYIQVWVYIDHTVILSNLFHILK